MASGDRLDAVRRGGRCRRPGRRSRPPSRPGAPRPGGRWRSRATPTTSRASAYGRNGQHAEPVGRPGTRQPAPQNGGDADAGGEELEHHEQQADHEQQVGHRRAGRGVEQLAGRLSFSKRVSTVGCRRSSPLAPGTTSAVCSTWPPGRTGWPSRLDDEVAEGGGADRDHVAGRAPGCRSMVPCRPAGRRPPPAGAGPCPPGSRAPPPRAARPGGWRRPARRPGPRWARPRPRPAPASSRCVEARASIRRRWDDTAAAVELDDQGDGAPLAGRAPMAWRDEVGLDRVDQAGDLDDVDVGPGRVGAAGARRRWRAATARSRAGGRPAMPSRQTTMSTLRMSRPPEGE